MLWGCDEKKGAPPAPERFASVKKKVDAKARTRAEVIYLDDRF